MNEIKLTRAQAMPIIKMSFPKYNGRKIALQVTTEVTLHDLNWSGGTRSEYVFKHSDGRSFIADNHTAPWNNKQEGATVELKQGVMCICHTIFCGKDVGLRVYVHPDDMPKWLNA